MNALETRTLEAFLRAISSHSKQLPSHIQQDIVRMGQDLSEHKTQSLENIPRIVQQDADLHQQYEQIYRQLQSQYVSQERTKSLTLSSNGTASIDSETQIAQILTSDNLIQAVQQFLTKLDRQVARQQPTVEYWQRLDRMVKMVIGGAFLGVLLAEIPGALVVGTLAALYGWFSYEASSARGNSQASR